MPERRGEVVCVTGGSGYIGSWIVQLLLHRGYTVHATVINIKDEKETKHLESLEGANHTRLRLFQMDLLDYDSITAAVAGSDGVFHVASPCTLNQGQDPQRDMLDPAIKGTINVLRAAEEGGVRRVVVTSSASAMVPNPNWPADVVKNEECWTDEEYCKQKGVWYPVAKTLAEKAAWKFAGENSLEIVVVNPGTAMGPIIPPALNESMMIILRLLQGKKIAAPNRMETCYWELFMLKMWLLHTYWYMKTHWQPEGTCVSKLFHIMVTLLLRWQNFTLNTMCLGCQRILSLVC